METSWRQKAIEILKQGGRGTATTQSLIQDLIEALENEQHLREFYSSYVPSPVRDRVLSQKSGRELSGERRVATIMFVDVCGFTTISEQQDPETVVDMLNRVFDVIVFEASSQGGSVDKFLGDAALISFGAPVTRGDDASRALITAIKIQEKMSVLTFPNAVFQGQPIRFQVSIGIHTGLVIAHNIGGLKRREYTVIGDTVNIAARLRDLAQPGEIIVSEATREQTRHQFSFAPIGACSLKGKQDQINAYRLGGQTRHSLGLSATKSKLFVGRRKELKQLDGLLEALREGRFGSILFRGVAGIGKSSLLRHWLDTRKIPDISVQWIAANFETRDSQLSLMVNLLCAMVRLTPTTGTPKRIRRRLMALIHTLGGSTAEKVSATDAILQILFPEHGQIIDFNQKTASKFIEAMISILSMSTQRQPMIFIIDNYQWVDEVSHGLIKDILTRCHNHQLLVILSSRPDSRLDDLPITICKIKGLSEHAARKLVANYFKQEQITGISVEDIVSRAKDHPLFIELLLNHVTHHHVDSQTETVSLPPDIRSAIMTLIDNLPEETRQAIQACSIIGNRMYADVVSGVLTQFTTMASIILKKLCAGGFLQHNPKENLYQFQQDLIREVVYETILLKNRRKWHQLTGIVMESLADHTRFTPEILAYHFKNGIDTEKGIFYLELAAQYADFLHQNSVSTRLYGEALEVLNNSPVPRPEKQWKYKFQIAQSYFVKGDLDKARELFKDALTIAKESDLPLNEGETLIKLGDIFSDSGDLPESIQYYEQAIEIFDHQEEYEGEIKAINALGIIYTQLGNLEKAQLAFQRGIECADVTADHQLAGMIYSNFGIFNSFQNLTDKAISAYLSSLYHFEQAGSMEGVCHSYHNLGTSYEKADDLNNAEIYYRKSLKVSLEMGDLAMIGSTFLNRSQLWLKRGDLTMAEALIGEALTRMEGLQNPMIQAEAYLTLAKISEKKTDLNQARKLFALAFRLNKNCHNILGVAAAGHDYGRVLLLQQNYKRAGRYLHAALDAYATVGDDSGCDAVKALLATIPES